MHLRTLKTSRRISLDKFYTLARIPPARSSTRRMVDSRYESLGRLGDHGVFLGTSGEVFLGPSRGHFSTFGGHFGSLGGSFWEPLGVILETLGVIGRLFWGVGENISLPLTPSLRFGCQSGPNGPNVCPNMEPKWLTNQLKINENLDVLFDGFFG